MSGRMATPASFTLIPGTVVYHRHEAYVVTHVIDLSSLLGRHMESGRVQRLAFSEISPIPPEAERPAAPDLALIPDEDWALAQERFAIIRPLLNNPQRTRAQVAARAKEFGNHANTLYGWIRLYEECGTLTVLMPQERRDKGKTKIAPEVEALIQKAINDEYLTRQQKSPIKVHQTVERWCRNAGLEPPHCNTVRSRINALPEQLKIHRRRGLQAAKNRFDPILGSFPGADYPYAVLQIDHTPLDIITVDDVHRLPLDRPYLTLAIDVFSRMVAGFYLSYDPPGAISTGMCLSQAILPKEHLLAKLEITTPWPCWGVPKTVHADNAKEFRGKMLDKACEQYGINLEWRPVARPNFGGHIERLLGTFAKEIHTLPGTTFSNIQQRGDYDSTKKSALTLSELESWLSVYITEVYHQRLHSGIQSSPIKRYEDGIFGSTSAPGTGLPSRIIDEQRLRLDFLPLVERTVQDYGLLIDDIYYYDDVLRRWINATVPGKSKLKMKFIVRRDPRDISRVWFFDPELEAYFEVPYRNITHPTISIWDLRAVKRRLLADGEREIDEDLIFSAYEKMHRIRSDAESLTKQQRRQIQRKKMTVVSELKVPSKKVLRGAVENEGSSSVADTDIELAELTEIQPFDEMEDY